MKRITNNKISIVGLGKLGLPLVASFASRGFEVVGIDVNKDVVETVNKGKAPFFEPALTEFLSKFKKNIKATQNHREAIDNTDITFVIVATPSNSNGNFSNIYLESALKSLAKGLGKSKKVYHLFVISSTVMPESIEKRLIPLIEKYSRRKLNRDFGVCYVPEFAALGRVIKDFLSPDLVIIGESNQFAGNQLLPVYKKLCKSEPPIVRMSLVSGEIAKIALNNYLTIKMSFANALANLCEKMPGADIDLITKAIGGDKRIAPFYFKGGLSFGGMCFPRDTRAYLALSKKYGQRPDLIKAVERVNKFQNQHLLEMVLNNLIPKGKRRASILGLAFKPSTPVVAGSPAIKLIQELLKKKVEVIVYDPLAIENTKNIFGNKIKYASSIKDCLKQSSFWVITTPDKEFKEGIDESFRKGNPLTIIDCWRILNPQNFSKKVKYIKWGYYEE